MNEDEKLEQEVKVVMRREARILYKCRMKNVLWWEGKCDSVDRYLVQLKDGSYRLKAISGISPNMKYKFSRDEIDLMRALYHDFNNLFELKEVKSYIWR